MAKTKKSQKKTKSSVSYPTLSPSIIVRMLFRKLNYESNEPDLLSPQKITEENLIVLKLCLFARGVKKRKKRQRPIVTQTKDGFTMI
jgi:hypothetical protein